MATFLPRLSSEMKERDLGAAVANRVRFDPPVGRAGEALASRDPDDGSLDHAQGTLRVWVLEAEGLRPRAGGEPCDPYVTVALTELTRRRVRRTVGTAPGPAPRWREPFDFEATSASGQVVVDVWDKPAGQAAPDLLGKAVVNVSDCRPGVPHTMFKHLLEGKLTIRLLFDFDPLPEPEEEEEALEAMLQALQQKVQ